MRLESHSHFVRKVREGAHLLGSFAFMPSPSIVEVLGYAGLDFVVIDQEHSRKSWETVEDMVRASEVSGIAALVRVARNEEKEILHALEVGAAGIMVPFIESAADVRRATAAMRYPPTGIRGTCTQTRAAMYGATRERFAQFAAQRNRDLLLVGLIESLEGLERIGEILAEPDGLDVVFIGRSDLASALGEPGQSVSPGVEVATRDIIAAAQAARVQVGLAFYSATECETWARQGVRIFCSPSESGILFNAVTTLRSEVNVYWDAADPRRRPIGDE